MDIANLDGIKRAQLQKLAKEAGIKANRKTEYLIAELKKYYSKTTENASSTDDVASKSEAETTSSSQTEVTECETSAESEMEAKPKATKGRRGRSRKQASRKATEDKADTTVSTESESEEPVALAKTTQEAHEADTESPSSPKRKARRGRRGRKRAASPPAKEPTPAKIQKKATPAKIEKIPTPAKAPTCTPAQKTEPTKSATPAKTEAPAVTVTPAQVIHVTTSRGSTSRRSAKKATTPVADKEPVPTDAKATPEVTSTEATKPTTRSSSGRKAKKEKRSTFEIDPVTGTPKPTSAEKKEKVKPEKEVKFEAASKKGAKQKAKPSTRIPKLKTAKPVTKPLTPGSSKNWAKIHAARMEKMESIDDYLEWKRKRTENLCASVKRAKIIAEEAKAAMETLKAHRTPQSVKGKMGPKIVKPVSRPVVNFMSPRPANKPGQKAGKLVGSMRTPAAAVTKTPQQSTGDAKNKCQKRISTLAAIKTARKSVGNTVEKRKSLTASTRKSVGENRKSMGDARKSVGDARKSIGNGTTPFKFGATQNTAKTPAKNPTFDIKASLSKGLTYKPYTGKLKPLGEKNYHFAQPKTNPGAPSAAKVQLKLHSSNISKAELKKPKVMSRVERQAVAMKHRAGKRDNDLMARRGIKS